MINGLIDGEASKLFLRGDNLFLVLVCSKG